MLLEQLNEIPFTSNISENIILIGELNLPNVVWVYGFSLSPLNSISQCFRIKNEYLDLFTTKDV